MLTRQLGLTGLEVPAVALGTANLAHIPHHQADRLLHGAVDRGVTLFDTARSYGSEAVLSRHLAGRRSEILLCTKVGYGIDGVLDWTGDAVRLGIDDALRTLRTDHLDIVLLHSCARHILQRDDVLAALHDAVHAGKVRVAGYAGDHDGLWHALEDARIQVVMPSASLFDRHALGAPLARAKDRGLGMLAKRPLANAPWRFATRPHDAEWVTYWDRMQAMDLHPEIPWLAVALRFVVFTWGIDAAVVGTTRLEHLAQALDALQDGPLPEALLQRIHAHESGPAHT